MDSPRGRIHLMTQVLDGAELTDAAATHFDRCLGCMACLPACPSGVRYDRLIGAARGWAEERPRSLRERAARTAIFAVFPYPRRLRLLSGPLRAAQRTGADRLIARSGLAERLSPTLASALRLAPHSPRPPSPRAAPFPRRPGARRPLPGRVPAQGRRRGVVGMLTGCVQAVFFPGVNAATARVLASEGCDVIIPGSQGCCGALSLHSGRQQEAARFARRTIETFEQAGVDAIVVNSAGCGSATKEYPDLLKRDRQWSARASAMSDKVRDFAEFLAELGPVAVRHPLSVSAAYHDACHLGHAQGITTQPRALLRAIPDLRITEIADGGTCCGSAGVYNLLQPEAARELGERKAASVRATGAGLLISANPGCSLQITSALASQGEHVAVAHTAEVLDASIRGLPVTALIPLPDTRPPVLFKVGPGGRSRSAIRVDGRQRGKIHWLSAALVAEQCQWAAHPAREPTDRVVRRSADSGSEEW